MPDFDDFASSLLDEAKRFLERAVESNGDAREAPNLHAALLMASCAFEAHLNAVCEEMSKRTNSPHEKSILLEREVRLKDGHFRLEKALKMYRLEDRLDFLLARFGQQTITSNDWRSQLIDAIALRNKLTHSKEIPVITLSAVRLAVGAVINALDVLYRSIYKKPFPSAPLGLDSTLDF